MSVATALGLVVEDAVVLNDSNRLVVHLMPCDIVARVTPTPHHGSAERELEVVKQLTSVDAPVGTLDARVEPRVLVRDGFEITMWTHARPAPSRPLPSSEYERALERLHAGLRQVNVTAPHVVDRIAETQHDVASRDVTPDLVDEDRALLASTLRELRHSILDRGAPEQLLHGEPHPGNVLDTKNGLLFIDFENTARGPVEYDLAWVPRAVSDRYRGADSALVDECRGVVLAIIAMHRWRRGDQHPSGRQSGVAFLDAVRTGPPWAGLDEITW